MTAYMRRCRRPRSGSRRRPRPTRGRSGCRGRSGTRPDVALHADHGLPDLRHVAALEAEGPHERLALEVRVGADDANGLASRSRRRSRLPGATRRRQPIRRGLSSSRRVHVTSAARRLGHGRPEVLAVAPHRRDGRLPALGRGARLREGVLEVHRDRDRDAQLSEEAEEGAPRRPRLRPGERSPPASPSPTSPSGCP